jgi:protein with PEP-CTERM/exosortase system signal
MKKIILAILATAFVTAQAYAFSGTIAFDGTMTQSTKKGVTTNHFVNPFVTQSGASGDYAVVPAGVSTTMTNFSFTGNNTLTPTLTAPVTPQWTFTYLGTTYSFDLTVLTSAFSSGGSISESGTGTAHINGQSAFATWSLDGTGRNFHFSASVHTTAIPDGGSAVALLGIALTGIEVLRRKLRIG